MEIKHHSNWQHAFFYIGLALLTAHELDAVAHHEWRLLPVLSSLSDDVGLIAFILIHIPVFTLLFWATGHRSDMIRTRSQLGVDAFLVAHGVTHFMVSSHELYEFKAPVETITVYGGAVIGLAHALWALLKTPSSK